MFQHQVGHALLTSGVSINSYTDSAKNNGGGPPCANEAATISPHVLNLLF